MQTTYCTTEQLAAQIAPYVGAKLRRPPRIAAIDIIAGSERMDADVRAMGETGVTMFWINDCAVTPWDKIEAIRIAALDETGKRVFVREYRHERMARAA